jgi:amino acid transporter
MTIKDASGASEAPSTTETVSHDVAESKLRGNLGTASLVFTVIAYNGPLIVLAGIVPLVIALGNGSAAPSTFLIMGVLVAIFAVGLNAMAVRMTHAGAFYTYVSAGIGRSAGLSAGAIAIIAYVTLCAGTFILFATSFQHLLTDVFGFSGGPPWPVWAALGWLLVSVLGLYNVELSAKVLGTASSLEIVLAVIWNIRVYIDGGPEGRSVDVLGSLFTGNPAFALVLAILCLTGFESLQVFRAETKDSDRTVPRATYISVGLLTAMYVISSYAYLIAYGASRAATVGLEDPAGSVFASIAQYVAKPAADIANILLTTSTLAACLAITNILGRYIFAFGRDGVLPRSLGRAHVRHGSPMAATAVAAAINFAVVAVVVIGGLSAAAGFASLTAFGAYCLILLYVVTSAAIFAFFVKRREPGISKWKAFIAPLLAFVGMGAIAYLSTVNFAAVLGQSQSVANVCLLVIAVAIVLGLAAGVWIRKSRPEVYARIGNQHNDL